MRSRLTVVMVGVAVAAALAAPPTVAAPSIDTARRELHSAERQLEALRSDVRRMVGEIATLDARLLDATTELEHVREELERAERELVGARESQRRAAEALEAVDDELEGALAGWRDRRERLTDQAVHAYKHGRSGALDLMVGGVARASDWHEVTVTLETVGRMVEDERALVDEAVGRTRETAGARAEVGSARSRALAAARGAAREQRRVERLLARQEALVAAIRRERKERASALSALEADTEARAELVAELRRQVVALELGKVSAIVPIDHDVDLDGPLPVWAGVLPDTGRGYAPAIHAIASRHGVDPRLLAAVVWAESAFRADAVSHGGAVGLSQLMPATARGIGVDPYDPIQNLDGGARYLRAQLDRFGSVELAVAAYNAGPGRVAAGGRVPDIVETEVYVLRVLDRYAELALT